MSNFVNLLAPYPEEVRLFSWLSNDVNHHIVGFAYGRFIRCAHCRTRYTSSYFGVDGALRNCVHCRVDIGHQWFNTYSCLSTSTYTVSAAWWTYSSEPSRRLFAEYHIRVPVGCRDIYFDGFITNDPDDIFQDYVQALIVFAMSFEIPNGMLPLERLQNISEHIMARPDSFHGFRFHSGEPW